jgi:hypothetical protein
MSRYATIVGGVVGVPRSYGEKDPGSVEIPDYVTKGDTTPDGGQTWYRGGVLVDPVLVPVTKLDIKRRVTPQEWAALKAAIASDADAQENWDIAQEIDPSHPQTQQVISYLQSQGQLSTPLWKIFAQ